ncbi:MAG: hypothetical protein LBT14_08135 [Treponema sp.]|jgi:hypothetical protein|nr:hypothetical protein [Treponema sp.]
MMAEQLLLRKIPPVLRARDFYLYTQGGQRLVDLWQYGGAAVLGHTPPHVLRELKNTANRGLFTPFPHPLENRLLKALSRIFPESTCRVYADEASLRRALAEAGFPENRPFPDPAVFPDEPLSTPGPSLWRPFLQDQSAENASPRTPVTRQGGSTELLVPVLPWALAPKVLVIGLRDEQVNRFPPSDILSPVLLTAAVRSIYDLIAAMPERGSVAFPHIPEALAHSTWRRRGIYLYYPELLDAEQYSTLFLHFLESGFLLPPSENLPLILPGALSPGEEAKLAALLRFIP